MNDADDEYAYNQTTTTPKSYYLTADNENALTEIFKNISQESTGGTNATLDKTSKLVDKISPYFQIDNSDSKSIVVKTADWIKAQDGTYKWGADVVSTGLTAVTEDDEKTIYVDGFDYQENWVGTTTTTQDGTATTEPHGKKLILEIPIKPADHFMGGNGVHTNDDNLEAGIYDEDINQQSPFKTAKTGTSNVPLILPNLTYPDKTIYRGNDVTLKQVLPDDLIGYLKGTANDYVDITFTLKNGTDIIASKTINNDATENDINKIIIDGIADPTQCTTYELWCTLNPNPFEGPIKALADRFICDFRVHVIQPELEDIPDVYVDYKTPIYLDEDVDMDNRAAYKTVCGCQDRKSDVEGIAPELSLKYTDKDGKVITEASDVTDADFLATEDREITAELLINGKPLPKDEDITETFNIHINKYNVEITKRVDPDALEKYPQTFVFNAENNGVNVGVTMAPSEFNAQGSCTKTITGYYAGLPTTVTENSEWSWRYTQTVSNPLGDGVCNVINSGSYLDTDGDRIRVNGKLIALPTSAPIVRTGEITIENELSEEKWLSGGDIIRNQFKDNGVTQVFPSPATN